VKKSSFDEDSLEGEEGLDATAGEVYPDATVKISRNQYSIFEIKHMLKDTKELIIDPDFQRNYVWKIEQERELIESVLMGSHSDYYVFEDEIGKKQVVDGRQRIHAIVRYLDDEYSLDNLKMLPRFNTKRFSDLEPLYQSKIERYQIPVYVIEPPTPERVKYDIFDRVNRGGTPLNNQEMRNALYSGQSTRLLRELSKSVEFQRATGGGIKSKRMRDQYIILRFIAFYLWRKREFDFHYKSNPDDFLAAAMKKINAFRPDYVEQIKLVFNEAMSRSYITLGADGFRFDVDNVNRRPINMALFETLAYFFTLVDVESVDISGLKIKMKELKKTFRRKRVFQEPRGQLAKR